MWRNIPIPGLQPRTAYGQTGANQWYGQLETGYRFDLGTNANAFVTPFARPAGLHGQPERFHRDGSAVAEPVDRPAADQLAAFGNRCAARRVDGPRLARETSGAAASRLEPRVRRCRARPVAATLAGAPAMPFTTFGISPQRDGVVIGLSANTAIADATSVYLRYEGDISAQDSAHAITAGVRMTW